MASSVTFVTAHEDPTKEAGFLDWPHLAEETGTIVFLMGAGRINAIASRLIEEGMGPDTPCALVQDATTFQQRHIISTLGSVGMEAKRHGFASPCIIVVGRVVSLSEKLYASKDLALKGMSVLITRPDHLAFETASLFASKGARAVIYPLIEISPFSFSIPDIAAYHMFIFTSQNAVTLFLDRLFSEVRMPGPSPGLRSCASDPRPGKHSDLTALLLTAWPRNSGRRALSSCLKVGISLVKRCACPVPKVPGRIWWRHFKRRGRM
jgi:uroporphyrinogen III methyltransferase/synthase